MSTTPAGQVTYRAFMKNTPVPVVDAYDKPIFQDGYVKAISETHWIAQGEIVQVLGASEGGSGRGANLSIKTDRGSTTGISADNVEAVQDPTGIVELEFELATAVHELEGVNKQISTLNQRRRSLRELRSALSSRIDALRVDNR